MEEKQNEIAISPRKRDRTSKLACLTAQEEVLQNSYSVNQAMCQLRKPTVDLVLDVVLNASARCF